jgi:hypothetical protein
VEAQRLIERWLEVFESELEGFEALESSFASPTTAQARRSSRGSEVEFAPSGRAVPW